MADESPGCTTTTKNIIAKFCIGHYSEKFKKANENGHTHKWSLFVRHINKHVIKDKDFISRVTYKLHPSFPNNIRTFNDPPFELSETGYGSFPLDVEIKFTGIKKIYNIKYQLELTLGAPIETFKEQNVMILDPTPQFVDAVMKINSMMEKKKSIMVVKDSSKNINDDETKNNIFKNISKEEKRLKKIKEEDENLIKKNSKNINNLNNSLKTLEKKSPIKESVIETDKLSTSKSDMKLNSLRSLVNKEKSRKALKIMKCESVSPPDIEDIKQNIKQQSARSSSRSSSRSDFNFLPNSKQKYIYPSDDSRSNTPLEYDNDKKNKKNSKSVIQKTFNNIEKPKNKILEKIKSDPDMLKDNKKRKRKSEDIDGSKGSPNDSIKKPKRETTVSNTKQSTNDSGNRNKKYSEDTETSRSITPQERKIFSRRDDKINIPSKGKPFNDNLAVMISDSDSPVSSPDNRKNNNNTSNNYLLKKDSDLLVSLKSKISSLQDPDSIYQVIETILKVNPKLVDLVDDNNYIFDLANFPSSLIISLSKIL
uniref:AHD domain-containing protein n=1 Tax=Parastrongyloides trichosuri TaxID=131310 RepID=A0A0N4ZPJ2_PARTI